MYVTVDHELTLYCSSIHTKEGKGLWAVLAMEFRGIESQVVCVCVTERGVEERREGDERGRVREREKDGKRLKRRERE